MHRRDFLRFLLTAPIAAQLDVEKLLWVPGEKTIFIPEPQITVAGINRATFKLWRNAQQGELVAKVWEECVKQVPQENLFLRDLLLPTTNHAYRRRS